MNRTVSWATGATVAVAIAIGVAAASSGTGVAGTDGGENGDDGSDQPITGAPLDRAVAAALAVTGAGTVTDTEIGDDGSAYSVEVRLENGSGVEVDLDGDFTVIGRETDDDSDSTP